MTKKIQSPTTVLKDLMDEYQLNPFSLSKAISLSPSAVRQILFGKSKITIPTALRLAKFFGNTPVYWLDLQRAEDLAEAENDMELTAVLKSIEKAQKPSSAKKPAEKTKSARKTTLNDKRKEAAKAPGSKPASRKPKK